nr:immunoglobulin heavy chain junction region [Mus musculus]
YYCARSVVATESYFD